VIFPLCPILLELAPLEQGRPFADALRWDPERPVRFGVRSREAGSSVRWFEAKTNGYMFHFGNAYEDGGRIVFDACVYPDGQALLDGLRTIRSGRVDRGFAAHPMLFEIDLASGAVAERRLDDQGAEFPRIDDRRVGHRNRYGYAAITNERGREGASAYFSTLVKYDRSGGRSVYQRFGPGRWIGEPVFVPRAPDAEEDDGFVLAVGYDAAHDACDLVALDARDFAGEPLARARLRWRVPLGFHGNFAAGV
jgi:carotenoid cleavage dioxygenase